MIADAGYESIENYLYLEEHGQDCFIKPQNHEKSKTRKHKTNKYIVDNLLYDKENENRSIQVEGAFGILKQDMGFRRFLVRGKKDVETQLFLLAFAF